ncbi:DUF551 domain-containing protein [Yersinia enterocolitica]|uniref:DUF551 domain-containing protein n=1 Tax=Yersinia enterocolitica TaxID=630 RepID=UPI003D064EBE
MKDLDSFTVERLEELIGFTHGNGIDHANRTEWQALARIALAAKRAEPVGYLEQNHLDYLCSGSDADIWPDGGAGDIPVYLTPQLNSPQGWIKCSDQMPEDDTLCLGVDECGVIWTMHFDDGEFRADTGDVDDLEISHWMPLPAAPEKPL